MAAYAKASEAKASEAKTSGTKTSEQTCGRKPSDGSATADHRPGAQAGADSLTIPGVGHFAALAFAARRPIIPRVVLVGADRAPFTLS